MLNYPKCVASAKRQRAAWDKLHQVGTRGPGLALFSYDEFHRHPRHHGRFILPQTKMRCLQIQYYSSRDFSLVLPPLSIGFGRSPPRSRKGDHPARFSGEGWATCHHRVSHPSRFEKLVYKLLHYTMCVIRRPQERFSLIFILFISCRRHWLVRLLGALFPAFGRRRIWWRIVPKVQGGP